jgi:hypothetical protein
MKYILRYYTSKLDSNFFYTHALYSSSQLSLLGLITFEVETAATVI